MTDAEAEPWTIALPSSLARVEATRRRFRFGAFGVLTVAVAAGAAARHEAIVGADPTRIAWMLGLAGGGSALASLGGLVGVAHAGKTGWAIARRAASDRARFDRFDRIGDHAPPRTLFLAAASIVVGVILAFFDHVPGIVVAVPAGLGVLATVIAATGSAVRVSQVRAALAFMRTMQTKSLADVGHVEGDIELALRVARDAPLLPLPFLREPAAAAQIRIGVGDDWLVRTWPDALPVEDGAGGSGTLALGAFELGGPRNANDSIFEPAGEPSPLLRALENEFGSLRTPTGATSLQWAAWGVMPGDALYVLGDAPSVRGGVGAYRGDGERAVRGSSERAAIAFVGDEAGLAAICARELRGQLFVIGVAIVCAASLLALTRLAAG